MAVAAQPHGVLAADGGRLPGDQGRKYPRAFARQLRSFVEQCPVLDHNNGNLRQNDGRAADDPDGEHDPNRISQHPIQAGWQSTPAYDFATGTYDQDYGTSEYNPDIPGVYDFTLGPQRQRAATQRRSVLFLKPGLYVVADVMTPLDAAAHTYQARWQLITPQTALDPGTLCLQTVDEGVPNLVVAPLLTQGLEARAVSAQETPEILGWNCRKDMTPQNLPSTTLLHTRKGVGVQRFLTLLLPLRPGEANPLTILKTTDRAAEIRLKDGRHAVISMTDDGAISVREILSDGGDGRVVENGPTPISHPF